MVVWLALAALVAGSFLQLATAAEKGTSIHLLLKRLGDAETAADAVEQLVHADTNAVPGLSTVAQRDEQLTKRG